MIASVKISRTTKRLVDISAEIMGEPEPDELRFLHTILAQCSLPYREPPAGGRDYIRRNGKAALIVSGGFLMDPKTLEPVRQGIPYGAKPRLLMIHLCTEAVRRQQAKIPIADSMSAFMRDLGLAVTGGKQGSIGRFKEQLNRLAASRMQLIMAQEDRATLLNPAPMISRFDVWFPDDPRQKVLWPSEVTLSAEFFESLKDRALPLDRRAIRGLQHNARALDIYTWAAHRLPRVRANGGDFVSWQALQGQFGGETKATPEGLKTFKREFLAALKAAAAAYPKAKVDQVDGGLRLYRSPPPIARNKIEVLSP